MPASAVSNGGRSNKELPPIIGEAKVREFDNRKNFAMIFFACSQVVVAIQNHNWILLKKKIPQ